MNWSKKHNNIYFNQTRWRNISPYNLNGNTNCAHFKFQPLSTKTSWSAFIAKKKDKEICKDQSS